MPRIARPWLDDVQRGDRLGQQGRIAIRVAGDQGAELNALGRRGERAKGGVRLEHRLIGCAKAGQLIEVVHHEDRVEARRFGFLRLRDHRGKQLGDAGAVREIRYLKSEFYGHVFT